MPPALLISSIASSVPFQQSLWSAIPAGPDCANGAPIRIGSPVGAAAVAESSPEPPPQAASNAAAAAKLAALINVLDRITFVLHA